MLYTAQTILVGSPLKTKGSSPAECFNRLQHKQPWTVVSWLELLLNWHTRMLQVEKSKLYD